MGRRPISILVLAREAEIDPEDAVLRLLDAGLAVESQEDIVIPDMIARARVVLGLPDLPRRVTLLEVSELSRVSGRGESETRDLLVKAGILAKRRLKRVPRHHLRRAQELLGIPVPRSGTEPQELLPPHAVAPRERDDKSESAGRGDTPKTRPKPEWPTIGPTEDLLHLTAKEVADIHWLLVDHFARSKDPIDPPGVQSEELLHSAVSRARTSLGPTDKYPTVAMAGASLLYAVVLNHPFHNGNKRTGLVTLVTFLDRNGWTLVVTEEGMYRFLLDLADHRLVQVGHDRPANSDAETLAAARWVQGHIRRVETGEFCLQFRQLRSRLEAYECELTHPKGAGNRVDIRRGALRTQVAYRNEGEDVERNTIHKIRKDLKLDEAHGCDSAAFYGRESRIPEFIQKYRGLLDRLAKV